MVTRPRAFASPAEVTPWQLMILSLVKLGVKCKGSWASSGAGPEHLRPEALALRSSFLLFSQVQAQRFIFSRYLHNARTYSEKSLSLFPLF